MRIWPRLSRLFLGSAVAGLAVFLAACGGSSPQEINVSMKEWSITPDLSQAKPGKVRFIVANAGVKPHEFVIIRSDLAPGGLPVVDGKVDEEKVEILDEIEPFAAGTTERKTLDLKAGKYILICNVVERVPGRPVESHYELGMRAAFTVSQ